MSDAEREFWLGRVVEHLEAAAARLRRAGAGFDPFARRVEAVAAEAREKLARLYRGEGD